MEIVVRQSAVPGPTAMEAPLPDFLKMWLLQLLISSPVDRRLRTPRSLVPRRLRRRDEASGRWSRPGPIAAEVHAGRRPVCPSRSTPWVLIAPNPL